MEINRTYWENRETISAEPSEKENCLRYEIDIFRKTCLSLYSNQRISEFENNLLVESLAIHTRILVDFFYNTRQNPNDIIAQDFMLEGENWTEIRPSITQILYDAKEKANKQLAHLSVWRIKLDRDGKKGWDKRIKHDIESVIEIFEKSAGIKFLPSQN